MIHTTIRPSVSPQTITKVTRLFNGTIEDILNELLQNSRRANASWIGIVHETTELGTTVTVSDNGSGIADPAQMLALGDSGWGVEIAATEDPAGMGVFSLAGTETAIISRSAGSPRGWTASIPADGWTGDQDIAVREVDVEIGTTIRFFMPGLTGQCAARIIKDVCKFYPLPVIANGCEVPREDFLAKAIHVAHWNGSWIGVFEGHQYHVDPTVNFHGLLLKRKLAGVSETLGGKHYHARLDIGATPDLALVLPARKEFVENDGLTALLAAARRTIFEAIAAKETHRLSFDDWKAARDLGVEMGEAEAVLPVWHPRVAEQDQLKVDYKEKTCDGHAICVDDFEPDIGQAVGRALRHNMCRHALVESHDEYAGYAWYDRLHRLGNVRFYIDKGETRHIVAGNGSFPSLGDHIKADRIELRYCIYHQPTQCEKEYTCEADVAFSVNEDGWYSGVDQVRIAFVANDTLTPEVLADLIEDVCFCASDDSDADSWETQHEHFMRDARELAAEVLLGADEAIASRVRDTIAGILWVLPKDRSVTITVDPARAIAVTLSPAGQQE
jgi:hypothetical protein